MWIVVSSNTENVYGMFEDERSALIWARTRTWPRGFAVRPIQGIQPV